MKIMSSKFNGVKALSLSNCAKLVFVGGDDGSFMVTHKNLFCLFIYKCRKFLSYKIQGNLA